MHSVDEEIGDSFDANLLHDIQESSWADCPRFARR
jgi:hypothetical protein